MKKNIRRILSFLLAAILVFVIIPISGVAAEDDEPVIKDLVIDENGNEVSKSELEVHISNDGRFSFIVYSTKTDDAAESVYTAEIVKYLKADETVAVPSVIDSYTAYPVRVIGKDAFLDNRQLEYVSLPETIEKIGEFAFANCSGLERIILPDNVSLIDKRAFNGCENLAFIHLPENLVEIGDSAFERCAALTGNVMFISDVDSEQYYSLVLPESVREIGSDAFSQCESLIRVIIPEGVTEIKTGTFTNCKGLERVEIPTTVRYIGVAFNSAFTAHGNKSEYEPTLVIKAPHAEIEVSPDIDDHMVVEGIKYSKADAFVRAVNAAHEASGSMKYRHVEFREIEDETGVHIYSVDSERSKVPTCTERGYSAYVCKCGIIDTYHENPLDLTTELHEGYRADYKDALGHDLSDWIDDSKAGCINEGLKHADCSRCDYIEYAKIPALDHKWIYTDTTTCTTNGVWRKTCSRCGIESKREYRLAYGHSYTKVDVIMERIPCFVDGIVDHYCTRQGCENPYLREIIPMHADANNDHFCDDCNTYLETTNDCDCDCHTQIGFKAWFYKIKLLVWKIFGVYKVCKCGISHY